MQVYYISAFVRIYTKHYNAQNFRKNLFKINTLPKMAGNAQNGLFDFGHWEIL